MKERPILFSAPMVRAILSGRKTMTRRIVKFPAWMQDCDGGQSREIPMQFDGYVDMIDVTARHVACHCVCPYCVGGTLWVRETHGYGWQDGCGGYSALRPSGKQYDKPDKVFYKADFPDDDEKNGRRCWRPSIHMPRWASRITLEVVDVRVERLQDISEADALAEGVEPKCLTCGENCIPTGGCGCCRPCYRESLIDIWLSINGPESWDANPWVWVVTFKRLEPKP